MNNSVEIRWGRIFLEGVEFFNMSGQTMMQGYTIGAWRHGSGTDPL